MPPEQTNAIRGNRTGLKRVSFYDGRFSGVGWDRLDERAEGCIDGEIDEAFRRRGLADKYPKADETSVPKTRGATEVEEIYLNEEEEAALDAAWKERRANLTEEEKRRSRMVPDPDDDRDDSTNNGGLTDADESR